MSAPRRGAPTMSPGTTRTFWRSIRTMRNSAASMTATSSPSSAAPATALAALISDRMQPGVVYTTFHHFGSGVNVVTTDFSDWATNCPEYKVTAVEVRATNRPSEWQLKYAKLRDDTRQIAG